MDPYISVIFPAYNEQERLLPSIMKTAQYFKQWPIDVEIVIVENGSSDDTYTTAMNAGLQVARMDATNISFSLKKSRPGKGAACKLGMTVARGTYILLTDVDLSTPIHEVTRLLSGLYETDNNIAIGSRRLKYSVVTGLDATRKLSSLIFSILAGPLTPGIRDTQCGFKLLERNAAQDIAARMTIDGFAFDVELLHIARRLKYKIIEMPVAWTHNDNSRVNVFTDSRKMAADLVKIGRNNYG